MGGKMTALEILTNIKNNKTEFEEIENMTVKELVADCGEEAPTMVIMYQLGLTLLGDWNGK